MKLLVPISAFLALITFGYFSVALVVDWINPGPNPCAHMTFSGYLFALTVFLQGVLMSLLVLIGNKR